ncbi:ABC transporter permease [Salinibacterium sp. NG22]|uniref:ABC transporter permease n=1 Tax=Salinibacterium sp. NG22 TaxID=2792040 RepID=UPI0018CEEAF0|nr:ABC transporter permease [Salinibacterium sp. NG22]MBH0109952.1 ABC transporter permease [Salinibacterium sp. NG22]
MLATKRFQRSAFAELSKASARELFRNVKVVLSLSVLFLFFLLLTIAINTMVNGGPKPAVAVVADNVYGSDLVTELTHRGIEAEEVAEAAAPAEGGYTAVVRFANGEAAVTLAAKGTPAWIELADAVHQVGIPSADIRVVDTNGFESIDFLRQNLATVLVMGFLGLALLGTAVPLVTMRRQGTLRLFGTTPVRRLTFLVAQTPVQFGLGVLQSGIVIAIAAASGYIESFNGVRLFVTLLLGLAMFFAFGYLLAARSKNPEVVQQLAGIFPILIALSSGIMFPLQLLPEVFQQLPKFLPTTWFMQAVSTDIAGVQPFLSVYILWAMMAATTALMAVIGARLFRWDQGDL